MVDSVLDKKDVAEKRAEKDQHKAEQTKEEKDRVLKEQREKRLKNEKNEELGHWTGTRVGKATLSGVDGRHTVALAETYDGIGPLVVPTPRGEIKAVSGDLILEILDETDYEAPPLWHVIPFEIVDVILDYTPPPPLEEPESEEQQKTEIKKLPVPAQTHITPSTAPTATASKK